MTLKGGCYCGAIRYEAGGEPLLRAQCHCRACQHFSGGAPNYYMLMPADEFRYVSGTPISFTRTDKVNAVTREFCATCGTHLVNRRPGLDPLILKIGTLDDPSEFGGPQMAIFTCEEEAFHITPEGLPTYETYPGYKGS